MTDVFGAEDPRSLSAQVSVAVRWFRQGGEVADRQWRDVLWISSTFALERQTSESVICWTARCARPVSDRQTCRTQPGGPESLTLPTDDAIVPLVSEQRRFTLEIDCAEHSARLLQLARESAEFDVRIMPGTTWLGVRSVRSSSSKDLGPSVCRMSILTP